MTEMMFACVSCGEETERDIVTGINECRVCRRIHCEDCLDKDGYCVPCEEDQEAR